MRSYNVKVYELTERRPKAGEKRRPKPWRLRWVVEGHKHERRYTTKALADQERSKLLRAMANGEAFDEKTGLPESQVRERNRTTVYEFSRTYSAMKWPDLAANSRKSMAEALVTVVTTLVKPGRELPESKLLRRALMRWAFQPSKHNLDVPAEYSEALRWIADRSVPLVELTGHDHELVRAALNGCARQLDGKPAAATTTYRKRAVLYNMLGYAVERGILDYNPIDRVQWKSPDVAEEVDRRVVASTEQVEAILACVPEVAKRADHYVAFYACLYYAGLRPSEAASLHRDDCVLPRKGWGRITLTETAPYVGKDWTDNGTANDVRGLKHRARAHTRTVPIPPELVERLRCHIKTHGVADDGRLFRAARGGYLPEADIARIWRFAREKALTPRQIKSPLAGRPYDLRHAALTLWLNGGVPAPEVARRAGHGVAVLLKVYAGCIDGEEQSVNARIEKALNASRGHGPDVGQTGDGASV